MNHSIYEAMIKGFEDLIHNTRSRLDDFEKEMDAKHYESGRHLASHMLAERLDVSIINIENIFTTYKTLKKEIYQDGGKFRRARN